MTLLLLVLAGLGSIVGAASTFSEQLILESRPGADASADNVLGTFLFRQTLDLGRLTESGARVYGSFPPKVHDLIIDYSVDGLVPRWRRIDVTLSKGRHSDSDDHCEGDDVLPSPIGLMVHVMPIGGDHDDAARRLEEDEFGRLMRKLSAVTGTSTGLLQPHHVQSHHPAYVSLQPKEPLCTENLRAWLSALPCDSRAGLGQLLTTPSIFDAKHQSLQWRVHLSEDGQRLSLMQTLTLLVEQHRWTGHYDLRILDIKRTCDPDATIIVKPHDSAIGHGKFALRDGHTLQSIGLRFDEGHLRQGAIPFDTKRFKFIRKAKSTNFEQGNIMFILHVHSLSEPSTISNHAMDVATIEQWLPWYVQPWLSDLEIFQRDNTGQRQNAHGALKRLQFQPEVYRRTDSHLVLVVDVSSLTHGKLFIRLPFDVTMLRFYEYPVDVHRGLDLWPARCTLVPQPLVSEHAHQREVVYWSAPAVAKFPTPDFSMPYNVIHIACSLVAFFHSQVLNRLTLPMLIVKPSRLAPILRRLALLMKRLGRSL